MRLSADPSSPRKRGPSVVRRARLFAAAIALVFVFTLDLEAQSSAAQPAAVVTAARAIARGTVLEIEDVATDSAGVDAGRAVVGWVARRVIAEGEALRSPAIGPPELIRTGQTVQLVWRQGDLEIRMTGRAMGPAIAGGKVLVRVDTDRRFEGRAEGPGLVRLTLNESI